MRNSVLLTWSLVVIAAMVVVLQVGVDGPVVTPAAPQVASAQPQTSEGHLELMQREYWPALQRQATAGDPQAQWHYGFALLMGTFEEPKVTAGIRWMEKAAEQKHGRALNSLGEVYAAGELVPPDHLKAIGYFQAAWAAGEPLGILNLGILSEHGVGRSRDTVEAVRCYRLAADEGSPEALARLGTMYLEGDILPRDPEKAVAAFKSGADKGSADASFNLALCYLRGNALPKDKEKALVLAEQAWAQGGLPQGALLASDLLAETRGDHARALAYLKLFTAFSQEDDAEEQATDRLVRWRGKLVAADVDKSTVLKDALILARARRQSKEIFGR